MLKLNLNRTLLMGEYYLELVFYLFILISLGEDYNLPL